MLGSDVGSDVVFATSEAKGGAQTASIACLVGSFIANAFTVLGLIRVAKQNKLLNEQLMSESAKPFAMVSILSCFGLDALTVGRAPESI